MPRATAAKKPAPKRKSSSAKSAKAKTTTTKRKILKTKAVRKAKPATKKTQVRAKAHSSKKIKSPKKVKSTTMLKMTHKQSVDLLKIIEDLINIKKPKRGGLKSLYAIDRIIDKNNQHFTNSEAKLNAIVKYGMEKDPAHHQSHVYFAAEGREKDIDNLFKILSGIGHGKIKMDEAKDKINHLHEESAHEK